MTFGLQLDTLTGFTEIGTLRTAREIATSGNLTGTSGSIATPSGVTGSNGGVLVQALDSGEAPTVRIASDGLTKWDNYSGSSSSTSFRFIWMRFL